MRRLRIAQWAGGLLAAALALSACAPPTSVNPGASPSAPAAAAPKNIIVINSGNPPGLDNRFVVTSNNASRIVLGLYAGTLIASDNAGARLPRLAEAVHILESSFRQNDQSLTTHPWLTAEYVGTGPFKLKDFVPGSHMELTAFDGYALGRPKLDQVQVRFIPDGGTMVANMLSGAGDLSTGTGPNVNQAQQLKTQNWDGQISATVGS